MPLTNLTGGKGAVGSFKGANKLPDYSVAGGPLEIDPPSPSSRKIVAALAKEVIGMPMT